MLDYDRWFQDLSSFAITMVLIEQHWIHMLRDGFWYWLRKGLIVLQPKNYKEASWGNSIFGG